MSSLIFLYRIFSPAYPDLNILLGSTVQLPCDLSPPGQLDPVMEEDKGDNEDSHVVGSSTAQFDFESIQLILWYHGEDISGSPFYSVDARANVKKHHPRIIERPEERNMSDLLKHFVMPPYGERIMFDLKQNPALLTIHSVMEEDAGVYWCRVDYRWTRTTISKIRLNVIGMKK